MLDVMVDESKGKGKLVKYTSCVDGNVADAMEYEFHVAIEVGSEAEAEALTKVVAGAKTNYLRANDNDTFKHNGTTTPGEADRAFMVDLTGSGDESVSGAARLKAVQDRVSKKKMVATFKFVLGGQQPGTSAQFDRLMLGGAVEIITRRQQTSMLTLIDGGESGEVPVGVGDIVISPTATGRVESISDGVICVVDFGHEYNVRADAVESAFPIAPPAGSDVSEADIDALLATFARRCERRDVAPSWQWLVPAMLESDEETLTPEIVDAAVERAAAAVAEDEVVGSA